MSMSYINIDELVLNYSGLAYIDPHDFKGTAKYFYDQIKAMPPADVLPAIYGHWIKEPYEPYKCSVCGRYEVDKEPFCHCGAKMIEVSE